MLGRKKIFAVNSAARKGSVAAHLDTKGTRVETLDNIEYLVVPVIPVKEAVLNGRFVSGEEINAHIEAWNGIPVPVDHPTLGGVYVSANDPDLIATQSIGQFFHAHYEESDKSLRGELWLNIKKAETLGGDALKALNMARNGEKLEVSSAFFGDLANQKGNYKGRAYNEAWQGIRPDHIAVLPNGIGACSWDDGCGVRAHSRTEGATRMFAAFARLFGINVDPETTEEMMKEKLINALIANSKSPFTETDRAYLTGLDEERLAAFAQSAGCACKGSDDGVKDGDKSAPATHSDGAKKIIDTLVSNEDCKLTREQLEALSDDALGVIAEQFKEDATDKKTSEQPETFESLLSKLPDSPAKTALLNSVQVHATQRSALIEALSKKESCKFNKAQLEALNDDTLAALAATLAIKAPSEAPFYGGRLVPDRTPATHSEEEGKPGAAPAPPAVFRSRELFDKSKAA